MKNTSGKNPVPSTRARPIERLRAVMACLRSPSGCPWDREQTHASLRHHAVEEVYELIDAIEAGDDTEMIEELGDLLLQVVFHCQLATERKAFTFDDVCTRIVDKLVRRHPHVFGSATVASVEGVWTQWEQIKTAEKKGTQHERSSVLDGVPRHLPALLRAEKLAKKASKHRINPAPKRKSKKQSAPRAPHKTTLGQALLDLAVTAQQRGWSAESLLREELQKYERDLRQRERER